MTEKNHTQNPFEYEGFSSPRTTQVPDDVFDVLMPQLKDAELRVLLYIIRRTYGFKKDFDNISLKQMVEGITTRDGRVLDRGTGLPKSAVARALVGLREKRIIVSKRNSSAEKGNMATTYRLRFKDEPDVIEDTLADPRENNNQVPLSLYGDRGVSRQKDKPLSLYEDTQQTVIQHTDSNTSNIRKSNSSNIHFVDNNTSQPISSEDTRVTSRNGSETHHGVEGIGSILNRVTPHSEVVQPEKRQRGRPRKFQDEESQLLLNYVSDFAREFADKATLNQSATRIVNLYQKWGKGNFPIFIDILYQARATTKAQNNIRTSKFAYFCSVLEDLLDLKEEPASVSGHHI